MTRELMVAIALCVTAGTAIAADEFGCPTVDKLKAVIGAVNNGPKLDSGHAMSAFILNGCRLIIAAEVRGRTTSADRILDEIRMNDGAILYAINPVELQRHHSR